MNSICLMGRLTGDPELKTTQNGFSVTSFSVAVDRAYRGKDQERQTDFINCVAWRGTAEFISRYFRKGQRIALAELIVPELTESQVQNDARGIRKAVRELLRMSLLFSGAVALFMFLFANKLGVAVYNSREAGEYIRLLAPLIPIMYTDMTVDGCLKGLGQQVWSMGINIADALLGLAMVWWLLPKYALAAYIGIIYFTELFNFVLSILRLRKITAP